MSDSKTRRRMNEREWLCFEDGVNWERERIIKLLEGLVAERKGTTPSYALLDAIALIKGEK